MNLLPPELQYQILLLTPREDLVHLCHASRDYLEVCSSAGFWRRKFREENIPLIIEGGDSFSEWLLIYDISLLALEKNEEIFQVLSLHPFQVISLNFEGSEEPFIFTVEGKLSLEEVEEVLISNGKKRVENVINSFYEGRTPYHSFLTEGLAVEGIEPTGEFLSSQINVHIEKKEKKFYYSFAGKRITLTEDELFFLLYKFVFFLLDSATLEELTN